MQLKTIHQRKRKYFLLILLLSAVGMMKTYAQSFSVGDLNYSVNNDGISATVTGHVDGQNATGELVIPDEVVYEGNSYTVTRISGYAFLSCSALSGSLTIPNSVTSIGESAFMGCIGFSGNLIIGNSVTSIGSCAFFDCSGFTGGLVIPNTVTTIQGDAFYGCSGFTGSLIIPNSVTVIEKNAFRSCSGFTEIHYNATNCADVNYSYPASSPFDNCGGYLIIGDNVERIPKNMFTHGGFVGELVIPNSVTTIGQNAFSGCSGFTGGLVIPNSVTEIDNFAFSGCRGFTNSLTIPNSMISIGQQAFYNCTGFTSVYYTGSISQWCNISFGDSYSNPLYYAHNLYINNELLVDLSIPENVAIIKSYAFCRATCINTLTIPNSVIEIGDEAFNGCSSITGNLIIPNSVTAIGGAAFSNCSGFTGDLTIPNSITTINISTFYNCSGFTGILTIPSSIITIGLYAFMNCGFEEVQYNATNCADFSDNYGYPFSGCGGMLIIGDNVVRIPAKMFYNAAFSGILTIGNSVTTIGISAFYNCNGFTGVNYTGSIAQWCDIEFAGTDSNPLCYAHNLFINNELIIDLVIPETITMIKPYSFYRATCLTSLTIPNSVTLIGNSAFSNCSGFTGSLTIPNSVTLIGNSAFSYCSGFTGSLTIPNSVTTLGPYAFYGCLGFTGGLTIPNSVMSIGQYAFYNCSGFTSNLTIPNSVTTIDNYAFYGCSGFASINSLAETPPSVGISAFYNLNFNMPVTVPCGTINAYQNASGWNQFTNIHDTCIYEVAVTANPIEGGTTSGTGTFEGGEICTLTATPNDGYSFCSWTENDSVVAYSPTYSFIVLGDRNLVANFGDCSDVVIGDGGASTNTYLPSYSYYKYSLTQQIYTAEEIGKNGSIISVAFYNGGSTKTRDYEIYMVNSDKTSFGSTTDWITATADDLVYSGSVTMEADTWTTIIFDTPFTYDGISNLALIVDDNSGNYTNSPHMACRVFDSNGNQAIRIYSDNTNYDPNNPTQYNGTLLTVKNQIILGFENAIETNISAEICQGDNYLENGFDIYYPEVGENQYSITLPSAQGNDSIVNLLLTVYPVYFFAEDTTLCNATSYTWRGNTYTESGIYYDSLQTVHGCDSIFQLSLELFNTPLGEFAYMTPTNNYPFTSLPITFSWDAVSGAEYYNLYLWNANDPAPSEPVASNIYNRSYYASSLQNHQTYNWYVEAVNTCFSSTSSVRSFTLNIPPTMHASTGSLNFGEVALNNSHTLTLYVSGNALDDAITLQITGEDASMFSFEQGSNWNGLTGGSLTVTFSPTAVQYNYTANLVITTGTLTQTVQLTGSLADMFVFNTYVTQDVFEMNSTIPIYGTVTDVNNNPMAGAEVEVKVEVMGTTRSLFATTGDDGHFSVEFVPANSESGYYTVNSGRVGHNNTAVHDDFNIPGMNLVTNGWILWDVVQNETTTGSIVIRNRSQIPLTNIQVTATTLPEGCAFTFQPLSLQGMEEGVLEYSVTGSALTSGNNYEEVRLVATSAEGASMNFSAWYYCAEPRGILYAAPNNITTTMTKGNSKIVDVMLYNNGTGPTGDVYLELPSEDWLSVVGNDTLPSIAVHDSAYFSLRLSANENTSLVQYSGNIAINCERGDGLSLPYTITAVSDSTGMLLVDVTDDYTYNGNGQHLAGATVTVKGYYSLQTVAIGLTGSDGTFTVEDIPEGYYRMSITAPRHAEYQATIQIEGGQTNTQNIYLQYQAITYSWNVVPTEIEDEYTFELIADFETNVPVPVVVIDMPQTFPELEEGESYVFDYIITNYGLVDTYDATLYPPTGHPLYDFIPLITEIDTLHAQSTVVVPCTMTRRTRQRSQAVSEALGRGGNREETECPYSALTQTKQCYTCGDKQNWFWANVWRIIGGYACETVPYTPTPGAPAAGGGGGSGGGGAASSSSSSPQIIIVHNNDCNSDPCLTDTKDTIDNCPDNGGGTPPALPPQNPANNR